MKKFWNQETFEKIKEILSNKQYRAIMFIGVYLIFSAILVVMVRSGHQNINYHDYNSDSDMKEVTESALEHYQDMVQYSSRVRIMIGEISYDFYMNRNHVIETITGLLETYYIEDGQFYYIKDGLKIVPEQNILSLKKLHPDILKQLINTENFVTKTEYQDGSISYVYSIDLVLWNTVMDDVSSYQNIQIEYKENNGKILSVVLKMDADTIEIYYDYANEVLE